MPDPESSPWRDSAFWLALVTIAMAAIAIGTVVAAVLWWALVTLPS